MKRFNTPDIEVRRFRVGNVKYIGRGNFEISDQEIANLIERHESGDFGDISDQEWALNERYIDDPSRHNNSSVQSRYTTDNGTVSISTTGIGVQLEPDTEILFNNIDGGLYDGKRQDDESPIPPL